MIIYLASASPSRQRLLREAGVEFTPIAHTSPEIVNEHGDDPISYVRAVVCDKMRHVAIPPPGAFGGCVVITADTIAYCTASGEILGKPRDREDAKRMIRLMRTQKVEVLTAVALERRVCSGAAWQVRDQEHFVVSTTLLFDVPDDMLDAYLDARDGAAFNACGGAILETYGGRFVRALNGSYTSVLGLPLYELCEALRRFEAI